MRTSSPQYALMVDFMEKHGDLSKPGSGPRGRHFIQLKWKELTIKFNSYGSGESKPEEKWRKVWSDLKNNSKKKLAKINRAIGGTGGGPALQLSLIELESRVIQIIGVQAATGMDLGEAGFSQDAEENVNLEQETKQPLDTNDDWNIPSTSRQPTMVVSSKLPKPSTPLPVPLLIEQAEDNWKPPQKKIKQDPAAKLFVACEKSAREYARERDRMNEQLEKERLRQRDEELRLRELDLRERVRQRDVELQLQAQWQELFRQALNVIQRLCERYARND